LFIKEVQSTRTVYSGFKAKVGVREGLRRFAEAYMQRTSAFLEERIRTSCGPRTRSTITRNTTATANGDESLPDHIVYPPQFVVDNEQLDKLNGCTVHIVMDLDGELATLGPPPEHQGGIWTAMRDMPPFQFHTMTSRSRRHDGRETLLIRITDHDHYHVGLRNTSLVGPVTLERMAGYEVENNGIDSDDEFGKGNNGLSQRRRP
jgi:hypothetical protein